MIPATAAAVRRARKDDLTFSRQKASNTFSAMHDEPTAEGRRFASSALGCGDVLERRAQR